MRNPLTGKSSRLVSYIFTASAAIIFFVLIFAYKNYRQQEETRKVVTQYRTFAYQLSEILISLKSAQIARLQDEIAHSPNDSSKMLIALTEGQQKIRQLDHDFKNKQIQMGVQAAAPLFAQYRSLLKQKVVSPEDMVRRRTEETRLDAAIEKHLTHLLSILHAELELQRGSYLTVNRHAPLYMLGISFLTFLLLLFSWLTLSREARNLKLVNGQLSLSLETALLAEQIGKFGTYRVNLEKNIYEFSENHFRLYGFEPNEFEPDPNSIYNRVVEEDRVYFKEQLQKLKSEAYIEPFRYRAFRKDGTISFFQISSKIIRDADGDAVAVGIVSDISQEVEKQTKLEKFNALLMSQNVDLTIANETFGEAEKIGRFGTWQWFARDNRYDFSENLKRMYGLKEDETLTLDIIREQVHPEDRALVNRKIQKMLSNTPIIPFVYRIYRRDDKVLRYFSVNSRFIENDPDIGAYVMTILRDVTLDEERQRQLEAQNRILEANNRELEAFNYVASHDLQEPLRKIETFISRLADKDENNLSESGKTYLERIRFSAARMRNLINDLLNFSRNTKVDQEMERLDLNKILEGARLDLENVIKETQAQINSMPLPEIRGVDFQMQQLFVNIIGNSLKYRAATRTPRIDITCTEIIITTEYSVQNLPTGKYYKIIFEDNGIGFEQQYADRIFALFNRLHGKTEYEGTGIGLAICKKIVENHKGAIHAEGRPGMGAKLTVILPKN